MRPALLKLLLGVIPAVEFLGNIMVGFSASQITGGIGGDPRSFAMVTVAYAVGSMLMIVSHVWFAHRYGYRNYLVVSLTIFIAGCEAAAHSVDVYQLVVARVIQGFGGGALFTGARVLVPTLFEEKERQSALYCFGNGLVLSTVVGPALAGELLEHGTWPSIFYASIPLAVIAMVGVWFLVDDDTRPAGVLDNPDWVPLLVFCAGAVLLLGALNTVVFDILSYPLHLLPWLVWGGILLIWFLLHQRASARPLVRLGSLGRVPYLRGLAMYGLFYFSFVLFGYAFPIFAGQGLGFSVERVGWLSALSGAATLVGTMFLLPVALRLLADRPLIIVGFLLMAGSAYRFTALSPETDTTALLLPLVGRGLFIVFTVTPVARLTLGLLPADAFAPGYQAKNLLRQMAQSFAGATAATFLLTQQVSVQTALIDTLGHRPVESQFFIRSAQSALAATGVVPQQAHAAALGLMAGTVQGQTSILASQNLFWLLMAVSLAAAVVVFVGYEVDRIDISAAARHHMHDMEC